MKSTQAIPSKKSAGKSIGTINRIGTVVLFSLLVFLIAACSPAAAATAAPVATDVQDARVVTLKIGVSPVPHGDIIKFINENLAEKAGLKLDIVEFTDYVQPNLALADGQLDANFFQHLPYLEDFCKEHKLDLVSVAAVHIEPLGVYSKKVKTLAEIPDKAVSPFPMMPPTGGVRLICWLPMVY